MSKTKSPVLIIEDEEPLLKLYLLKLRDERYHLEPARSLKDAREKLMNEKYHVVLTDIKLQSAEQAGLTLLEEIKKQYPATQVILFSGIAGTEEARQARRLKADGFLTKPLDYDNVRHVIHNSITIHDQLIEAYTPDDHSSTSELLATPDPLVYYSEPMKRIVEFAIKLSKLNDNILIVGESGTGKGLIAEGIHFGSNRQAFELVNCGSLSERSLGRILFGYYDENVDTYQQGVLQRLKGGTLVLDRVSGLSLALQHLLLQALRDKIVTASKHNVPKYDVDLRVIAIDETDLQAEVNQGIFLYELYDFLAKKQITVPALRDRIDGSFNEVVLLAENFIEKFTNDTPTPTLSPESVYILESYPFPQNVSELQSVIRFALHKAEGAVIIEPKHLPLRLQRYGIRVGFDTTNHQDPILCPHGSFHCNKIDSIAIAHRRSSGVYLRLSEKVFGTVSRLLRKYGLEAFPPEEIPNALTPMCTHCFPIQSSKYAIVDVSSSNAQVLYEVGLLHALGIPTLLVKDQFSTALPTLDNTQIQIISSRDSIEETIENWLRSLL